MNRAYTFTQDRVYIGLADSHWVLGVFILLFQQW